MGLSKLSISGLLVVIMSMVGCATTEIDPPDLNFDYYSPGPTRSILQKEVDGMTWAFWIRRLQEKGIDINESRSEMTDKENSIVDEVQRQTNVYERYLVVLVKEKKAQELGTRQILTVLENETYSGERLNDEIIPYAWKNKRADYFQKLLDWVPPELQQQTATATPTQTPTQTTAVPKAEAKDSGGFFDKLKSMIPKSSGTATDVEEDPDQVGGE
ncbi:MAG: hypothetical protein OQK12_05995 [Motiliproteus sp.]|nr:hypothetical protein [Motiliproteus sp.]MCW9054025.1 hypothetical protein [Motiliproteus sp.]